jgi:hypothetical protein
VYLRRNVNNIIDVIKYIGEYTIELEKKLENIDSHVHVHIGQVISFIKKYNNLLFLAIVFLSIYRYCVYVRFNGALSYP